jgi:hypothetical protein
MRKSIFSIVILFIFSFAPSFAQDIGVGGGLVYGTKIKNIGLNFRADVKFQKQWSITPHFNYFFNKEKGGLTTKWNALNVDGHYLFDIDNEWLLYPLFGINFASVAEEANDITFSNSEVGINLGFGSEFNYSKNLSGFSEIKYVISDADQLVITLGILYNL